MGEEVSENENKPRGRPKDLDKRAAVISAAHRLFLGRGLDAVTVEEIASEAGVSKMTVYANFDDKGALFEAVVELQSTRIQETFERLQIGGGRIDVTLSQFGTTLLAFLLSPEIIKLDNVISSEMARHPGLGQRFYEAGPHRMWHALTAIIEAASRKGEVRTDDAKRAAEDLISLWLGMTPLQHRMTERDAITAAEISNRVTHGVAVFMKAYAVDEK